uniref:Uncharacterized protein n=1 Tax=Branchiostoma floridae TaxID=7739 RepID=C3XVG4_BRAFL|eukprot:XP_002612081.1 hypothetical protein BRAFLDRAFT_130904 [Branchiostoma floridae]
MGGARGREEERTHKDARRSLTLKRTPARRNLPYHCIDTRGAGQDAAGTGGGIRRERDLKTTRQKESCLHCTVRIFWPFQIYSPVEYSSNGQLFPLRPYPQLQRRRVSYMTITSDDGGSSRSIIEAAAGKRLSTHR